MSVNFNWTCPHCRHPQTVTDESFHRFTTGLSVGDLDVGDDIAIAGVAISCQNQKCKKLTLTMNLHTGKYEASRGWVQTKVLREWKLLPESSAKPQPDYVPQALRDDYIEACRIVNLSPKASATLARRCLQGMIRNFCGIAKPTLAQEITALETAIADEKAPKGVTPESVEAIDHVRKIGNIGAHMEKDIDLIIDIDPEEAQLLIELIETLFDEWYVAREQRQQRFAKIAAIRAEKDAAKNAAKPK